MSDSIQTAESAAFLQRLGALFDLGGPVVMLLMAMSVLALAIVLLKLWQFFYLQLHRSSFVENALQHLGAGRYDDALVSLRSTRNPIGRVMAVVVEGRRDPAHDDALVREEATRVGARYLEALRGQLRGLEVIGALSPLLGLLGTVLGMIEAFRQLESAGSQVDPAVLSGGIWEALLTTAVGLAVAIPVVAALNWLERRVDRFRHQMEDAVTRIFTQTRPPQPEQEAAVARPAAVRATRAADGH
ncbi:MAG: MotA/TolQ/ExbB proton channel family protein [Ectothiorhodospiraceae bacterium]|nr:MotA/TolQ/ExbB proton channel family protein [Ectothiorhodospiraceae bacterium]MCH8503361.1 MotA/TolQ/ExbB proton channel family protein [Ectothiorhodospiraceae bacterium]